MKRWIDRATVDRAAEPAAGDGFVARARLWSACILLAVLAACGAEDASEDASSPVPAASLVLYSSLPHARTLAVADAYRRATGTRVNFLLEPAAELIDIMAEKRDQPPADVLLIEGTGALARATERDVLRPVKFALPDSVDSATPMDPDGYWYGLGFSVDAVVVAGDAARVGRPTYADLSTAGFEGRLCMRRGHSERSRGLVAAILASLSPRDTELMVRGWRRNSMTVPIEGAESIAQALRDGQCQVAIMGSDTAFALGLLSDSVPFEVFLPTAEDGGAVLHSTVAGVSRHAGDAEAATAFLRWLLTESGQRALHAQSGEFPALTSINPPQALMPLKKGLAVAAATSAALFAYDDARDLIERAGYRQ